MVGLLLGRPCITIFTSLIILSVLFTGIKYIHAVGQLSPTSNSKKNFFIPHLNFPIQHWLFIFSSLFPTSWKNHCTFCMNLTILDISFRYNHKIHVLLWLAYFIYHMASKLLFSFKYILFLRWSNVYAYLSISHFLCMNCFIIWGTPMRNIFGSKYLKPSLIVA